MLTMLEGPYNRLREDIVVLRFKDVPCDFDGYCYGVDNSEKLVFQSQFIALTPFRQNKSNYL